MYIYKFTNTIKQTPEHIANNVAAREASKAAACGGNQ